MKTTSPLTVAILTAAAFNASSATRYVWQESPSPGPPYTNWASAAHIIQEAVDASAPGDEIVLTNGVYAAGGRAVGTNLLVNRVAVDKPLTLRSVNGPQFTIIQGYQVPGMTNGDRAVRCVYLTNGARLSGFTLTNGATRLGLYDIQEHCGGGLWSQSRGAVAFNCVLVGNSAAWLGGGASGGTLENTTLKGNSAPSGGGVSWGMLTNCALIGNLADRGGGAVASSLYECALTGNSADACAGGADNCVLFNCTLVGNSARSGGGVPFCTLANCTLAGNQAYTGGGALGAGGWSPCVLFNCTLAGNSAISGGGACDSTLYNCIVYSNTATIGANWSSQDYTCIMDYCCTTPQPEAWQGVGNITNAPLFVDCAGGNLRLQSNSPCINAGNNSSLANSYFTNCFALDGNPRTVSGTVDIGAYEFQGPGSTISYAWLQQYGLPTDGSADALDYDTDGHNTWQEWRCATCPTNSLSALRLVSVMPVRTNMNVTWQSVVGVHYCLEKSTNLTVPFVPIASGIPGQFGTTSYIDTNAATVAPLFYRVGATY